MAIDASHWKMILAAGVKGKALSAGYPDLLVREFDIPECGLTFQPRKDTKAVQKLHGWDWPIFDTGEVLAALGLELDVIDRAVIQGCERVVDLNASVDLGEYDLVIDPGTSEHCFNIPQALVNLAHAVKVGGCISQALPMAMFNHGYWNVNPCALIDFYEQNGFTIEDACIRSAEGLFRPVTRQRMRGIPDGAVTILTARRTAIQLFQWPQQ